MLTTVGPDSSLLNESGFLRELASLDNGLTTNRKSPLPVVNERYEPLPDVSTPVRTTPPGIFADEPAPAAPEVEQTPSFAGQLAAAAMFVLMMGAGAAGAAVVFREQVARILATW